MGAEVSERKLIREAQRGSGEALAALYSRHWGRAQRAAYLVVHDAAAAEDIAQEAFLAAVDGLDRFDRRRPFAPWLHRIVVNRAIDWGRRGRCAPAPASRGARCSKPTPTRPAGELMPALAQLPPSSAPWSCSATCSSTPPGRSGACSSCRGARSTRACAAAWTACAT